MIQPISGSPLQPTGNTPEAGNQPLSGLQRTALESLLTRVTSLTKQQKAEVWAAMKHAIGLQNESPLLSRHFPAAERFLNQLLMTAQKNHTVRQLLSQLNGYLQQGNNRQAVSQYIRQQYGQTVLNKLSPEQLQNVLTLLQEGKLAAPQPQQRLATTRPLLPAEHSMLNQLVTKLAASTGEPGKQIWQSMLELSGVKDGELIPAEHFPHLVDWLQARQTLSQQRAPTLETLLATMKQIPDKEELESLKAYAKQEYALLLLPQTILTHAQAEDLLNLLYRRRTRGIDPRDIQPLFTPFPPLMEPLQTLGNRPGVIFFILIFVLLMLVLFI